MKHQVSIMSDWVLLGLIAVLVVLLLLTVFGFAVYSGLFTEVVVSAGSPPIGSITLAYKFRVGPYGESGQLFTDGCSISSKLCSIGVYYDNPHTVSPEKCRFAIGRILSEGDAKPTEEQIRQFQKYGFKIFSFPTPSHVVMASFPFTTPLSIHLAVNRVHPALDTYIKERKLCAHPRLEIYKEDRIYFVCPLARQGDFYVPEMKELERKSRAVAAEAEDAQTDITGTVARVLLWPAAAHLKGLATLFPSPGLPWQSLTHPGGTRRALAGTRCHPWQGSELLSVQPWGRHQSAVVKAELGAEAFGCSWACFSPCHIHLS
nr:testis-expressed protein 264 isoform X2 [Anas platyrhynchos]